MTTLHDEPTTTERSAAARLRRTSRTLARIFAAAVFVLPLTIVLGLLLTDAEALRGGLGFAWLAAETLTFGRRVLLTVLSLLLVTPTVLAFDRLRALFALYAEGKVFTAANVACLRAAGKWLIWSGVAAILSQPILSLAVTLGTANQRLQLGLDSAALSSLLSGSVIYAIARVMEMARAIDEERSQFI